MELGHLPTSGSNSVLFQGEVTALRMSTDTDIDPPSTQTCASELPGNLINWVMFDDGDTNIQYPSDCPRGLQCPAGFKGEDCSMKIGKNIFKFCRLLIFFANSLDADQDRLNVDPDLDPNCLTL